MAGYGYSTPKTPGGKIFCMLYALTGIPLNLVMFQSIGERLNIFVTFTLRHLKRCFRFKSTEVSYIMCDSHSGTARLLFRAGHNSLHFPFSPLSSLPIPFPFFSYLHITNPLPQKILAAKSEGTVHCKSISSPAGPAWCILR